jgi:pimeloyl-ACP methyl ester carboxylesterase
VPAPRAQLTVHSAQARTLQTPGGAIAALDAAPLPDRPPLGAALLVPGFTGSKEDFVPLLEPLRLAGYRVVAYDQRGQHETPGIGAAEPEAALASYLPDALAQDLLAVAGQLPQPLHLVGHSFGGLVARAAVIAAPGAFSSLTLMSSGPSAIVGWRRDMMDALEPVLLDGGHDAVFAGMQQFAAQAAASGAAPASKYEQAEARLLAFLRDRFLATDASSLAGMGAALRTEPDRVEQLRSAAPALPVMVLYGDRDDAWPPDLQAAMARRLGAREVVLPGVGHSPGIEAPDATAHALSSFWRNA